MKGPFDVNKLPTWSGICALRKVCRQVYWEVERIVNYKLGGGRSMSGNGLCARLDIFVGLILKDTNYIKKDEGQNDSFGRREEESHNNGELGLLSTWVHVPVPFGWLKNVCVDLSLQSYRDGLFTATMFRQSGYHQVSGTIVKYFFELFCGLLDFDGRVRIQPERKWEKLDIRLKFDDDVYVSEHSNSRREGHMEEGDGLAETMIQYELWRTEAGNELKYLFEMIYETGILCGRLKTLTFDDGKSTVEWHIQKMMDLIEEPGRAVSSLEFTDLSRLWLAMGCEEVV